MRLSSPSGVIGDPATTVTGERSEPRGSGGLQRAGMTFMVSSPNLRLNLNNDIFEYNPALQRADQRSATMDH